MNQIVKVGIKKLEHFDSDFDFPAYETLGASGLDLRFCSIDRKPLILAPWERTVLPTGLSVEIPVGYEIQVRPRSGLSLKTGLCLPNSPGTIDSDYRGELGVLVANFSPEPMTIEHGLRVAQIVLAKVERLEWDFKENFAETARGEGGFGSTGLGPSRFSSEEISSNETGVST